MREFELLRIVIDSGGFGSLATTARFLAAMADGSRWEDTFERSLRWGCRSGMAREAESLSAPRENA